VMVPTRARSQKRYLLIIKRLPQARACPTRDKIVVRVALTIYPYSLGIVYRLFKGRDAR